jgi:hypothetical protein
MSAKKDKMILTLRDLFGGKGNARGFGGNKEEEYAQSQRIKEVASWITKQPISHLPYVEMGFDALDE